MTEIRLTRHKYFISIAKLSAERGTCNRAKVGAVATQDNRIIMSAYNGSPSGAGHCDDVGHYIIDEHCVRTVHAEQNIICQCAKKGVALEGATLYVTHEPCFLCMKLLISAGVKNVYYLNEKEDIRTPLEYYNLINVYKIKI